MAKKQNKTISVNDVTYDLDSLTETQGALFNHVTDLDRKIANSNFNLDQLKVGRETFVNMLTRALENPPEAEAVN